ncbi:ferredoxin [Streptomyces anulatus]|uniref:Ferredoxin n=1 Tax=Streptomyces anulatus TaxID=1892 RepID=A0ABZ1ZKW5_STRAQ|nr:ferredoxin [Streptomyces anulatus]WST87099.1 ferredoxin [Streptomyces anulatus]WSU30860.1 ferredoxin [Streptomyces anulatus]WSU90288.1 ferredoxin [Streptomyces anulatus]WSW84759.1 ferredoxin [Streptomyces anulatus]
MQITVDMDVCASHGNCVFAAPETFSFDDDDYLRYESTPDEALRDRVEKAAASCPVRAITVTAP